MMTAARAASSLHGTLRAVDVPLPVVLVGHSIAGLTTRLYVGEHPAAVAGVVLFDPPVPSFARMFDEEEFRPEWDGTTSSSQVDQVTTWPDTPSRSPCTIPPSMRPQGVERHRRDRMGSR